MSRPFKVMFARFPGGNSEHPASSGWMMETLLKAAFDPRIGRAGIVPFRHADTPITMSRNLCVKTALDRQVDYLLMIDSDMQPDLPGEQPFWETAWEFMMDRREQEEQARLNYTPLPAGHRWGDPIPAVSAMFPPATIAAPYCGPPPIENIFVFRWSNPETDDPNPNFRLQQFSREEAAVRAGIEEVAALPTGLILYDMRVFATLPPPWFEYEWADEPFRTVKASTEDVFQTRNASIMGLPLYVAWSCWAGHWKPKLVTRPRIVTRDLVARSLHDALRRPYEAGDRVMIVGSGDSPNLAAVSVSDFVREGIGHD